MGDGGALKLGRYESIRQLAQGGMATVYLGRALGVGGFQRLVAIKQMHPHFATQESFVSMFLDEARLTAKIRHPNVVPVLDIDEGEGGLFIVMDFVDGASLFRIQKSMAGDRIPMGISLRVVLDVLAGLHAAHELVDEEGAHLAIVHRDVSPHNVLVGTDGISRLTDFGVAKAAARIHSTGDGSLKGKISYMSPEQLRGAEIDRRVDVYAMGVVLWELLAGRRLFPLGDDMFKVMHQVSQGPASSPRAHADVPETLDAVCMKALAPLEDRFVTAQEFADALENAAAASGVAVAKTREVASFAKGFAIEVGVLPKTREVTPPSHSERLVAAHRSRSDSSKGRVAAVSPVDLQSTDGEQTVHESSQGVRPSIPVAQARNLGIVGVALAALVMLTLGGLLAMPRTVLSKSTTVRDKHSSAPREMPLTMVSATSVAAIPLATPALSTTLVPARRVLPPPVTAAKRNAYNPKEL